MKANVKSSLQSVLFPEKVNIQNIKNAKKREYELFPVYNISQRKDDTSVALEKFSYMRQQDNIAKEGEKMIPHQRK